MAIENKNKLKAKIRATIETLKVKIEELKEVTKPIAPENAIGRISRMDAINLFQKGVYLSCSRVLLVLIVLNIN